MKKFWITALCASIAAMAPIGSVQAQAAHSPQPVELKGDVKVDKVVIENGQERHVLSDPKVVVPGDKLVFSTQYSNTGVQPVDNFVLENPLPAGVMLAPEGAEKLMVSVDGGKTFGRLAALSVTGSDGAKRPAQAGDVTHIRWTLPVLAPGASGTVSFNAIIR